MDQKPLLRQQMRQEMDDEIVQRTIIHQAKVARLRVAAQWAHKHRVFRW